MNANITGIVAVGLGIVAFRFTHGALGLRTGKMRLGFMLVLAVFAVPSLLFAAYYLHIFPEWSWFYTLRSWRGTELLVIFLGGASGAAASLLPRYLLAAPLLVMVGVAAIPYMKPLLAPLDTSGLKDRWVGNACMQSTPSTCGPASVCTILRSLGEGASEREVAQAAFTYSGGTEAWYLARYVRAKGLVPRFDFRNTFSPLAGLPAMVGVRLGGTGHFIAVLEVIGDQVVFADPLRGEMQVSLAAFRHRYEFTGFHMAVTSN